MQTLVTISLTISLALFMLSLGMTLKPKDFTLVFKEPLAIAVGLIGQNVILPLVGLSICALIDLPTFFAVGLILIACSPGGPTSNIFTYLARGDVALSVSLTAISCVINVFLMPIFLPIILRNYAIDGAKIELPVLSTFIQIFCIVLIPLGLGMIISQKRPAIAHAFHRPLASTALVMITIIVIYLAYSNWHYFEGYSFNLGLAVYALMVISAFIGYIISAIVKLSSRQSRTIVIEIGIQNAAQALFIATSPTLLNNETFTIAPLLYGFSMYFFVFAYIAFVRWQDH